MSAGEAMRDLRNLSWLFLALTVGNMLKQIFGDQIADSTKIEGMIFLSAYGIIQAIRLAARAALAQRGDAPADSGESGR